MDIEDPLDYQLVHRTILMQAVDDFVKLMHPKRRRKKHLALAWVSATALIFDDDVLLELVNEYGNQMNLEDLLKAATDRENVDVEKFRDHVVNQAIMYWQDRDVRTVKIPKNVTVEGHVYSVKSSGRAGASYHVVDYDNLTINLYGNADEVEKLFCTALTEVMAYHTEVRMSKAARDRLAEAWFNTLRINNCFVGD